jgi:hypothetical protein
MSAVLSRGFPSNHFRDVTKMVTARIGRAFSPENGLGNPTQGVALGWYEDGPLALSKAATDHSAADALPSSAPTAQPHTSLGHRPR